MTSPTPRPGSTRSERRWLMRGGLRKVRSGASRLQGQRHLPALDTCACAAGGLVREKLVRAFRAAVVALEVVGDGADYFYFRRNPPFVSTMNGTEIRLPWRL
jgi:hypothetical protein